MRFMLGLALLIFSATTSVYGIEKETDPSLIWRQAYEGNLHLVQKMSLIREENDIEDEIVSFFALAYTYHRLGYDEKVTDTLELVDSLLEYYFKHNSSK